ncbi:MAG TPA: peptidoglycan-binding domain-containing protein [Solirubrobacteraceae bacterium]|nr:peptidoglycan-binding domain-containing protein [Solirubrobacteraceae bacterium]
MKASAGAERRPGNNRLPRYAAVWLVLLALLCPAAAWAASGGGGITGSGKPKPKPRPHPAAAKALAGRGMWIWYVSQSSGGSLSSIVANAHRYGLGTVMIKSGDGTGTWSQFSRSLVSSLHAQGLSVCGWQYVYGTHPTSEASVGAAAASNGADCLLIDAESEYEGKYVQAQQYIKKLRQLVGPSFPVALASFPYVDYHPGLPYSVFMGPGGAQYNAPQMYWKDIQTSVDSVYSHTFEFNLPYQRPIEPLGQVAGHPPAGQIERFRQLSRVYGAANVSWWDWQEASTGDWQALSRPIGSLSNYRPSSSWPTLSTSSQGGLASGDLVVWAQEHLYKAGYHVSIDGGFGGRTKSAVQQFQGAHGLRATGIVDTATWQALLRYPAANVTWTSKGAVASRAGLTLPSPRSAKERARAYETPPHLGRG